MTAHQQSVQPRKAAGPTGSAQADASGSRFGAKAIMPLVAVLVLIAGLAGWMLSASANARQELYAEQVAHFEDVTGIRVLRVVMTAGGGIVELQYQVLDPDKALAIHDDEAPPGLIDEKTGAIVAVPFHDHADRVLHTAVTYRNMFMNSGGLLKPGSRVTLTVGDAIIENIEVG